VTFSIVLESQSPFDSIFGENNPLLLTVISARYSAVALAVALFTLILFFSARTKPSPPVWLLRRNAPARGLSLRNVIDTENEDVHNAGSYKNSCMPGFLTFRRHFSAQYMDS